MDREFHETLNNEDPDHLLRVQMFFFKCYKGQKFDKKFLEDHKVDEFMRVPLTYEHKDLELPENLNTSMENCLNMIGNDIPPPGPEFKRFLELVQVYKQFFLG